MPKNYNDYTDSDLKTLLRKFSIKRQNYRRRKEISLDLKLGEDLFERSGLFENGRIISVDRLKDKYADQLHYKIAIMENMLDKDYIKNINLRYKDNMVSMLNNMGEIEWAEEVEKMSLRKFIQGVYNGDYDEVKERYDLQVAVDVAERMSKMGESAMSQEDMDFLGF
mgnify:CR=1 FL=1